MHQADYRAIDLRPQSGAIHQDKPLDLLWIATGESKSYCPSKRVADDAHAPTIRYQGIEEARQKSGQRWPAVISGRFSAAACTDEVKCADTESRDNGGRVS